MTTLADFTARLDFRLDDFQRQACEALAAGHGVLVCAPTGAGKTIVGEFAVHLALASGTKCFYTTPIKALSNQKFHDLVAIHGAGNVGLLTGDNSINADAPVVVMTTEVVRNMIYAQSPTLNGLSHVVMDEVHFLADRFRGAVGGGHSAPRPVGAGGEPVGDGVELRGVRRVGSKRCAVTRPSSSTKSGRSRCGSTCWWATGCSTCTTRAPSLRAASASTRADALYRASRPVVGGRAR